MFYFAQGLKIKKYNRETQIYLERIWKEILSIWFFNVFIDHG